MALLHAKESRLWSKTVVALLLSIPGVVHSQAGSLQFQHVTGERGLSHPAVNEICQDSCGFMWFGAFSGLNRFDGRGIRWMEMPTVHALCTDREGSVWIGTTTEGRGLHRISVSRDTIVSYDPVGVRSIVVDEDSTLWVGAAHGLFHVFSKDGRIEQMGEEAMANSGVLSMACDKRGRIWLVTRSSILCFDKRTHRSRLVCPVYEATHSSIAVAPDGTVWLSGGTSNQVCSIDPNTLTLTDVLEDGAPVSAGAIAVDSSGLVYVGTWSEGLKIYDPVAGKWWTYRHSDSDPQSIVSDAVNCVVFDKTGNLWVGTVAGVSWVPHWRKSFTRISVHAAFDPVQLGEVKDIVEDAKGDLWFGADGGVRKWERKSGNVVPMNPRNFWLGCLEIVRGNELWISTVQPNHLLRLDIRSSGGGTARTMSRPGIKERVTAMYNEGDTVMWLGCTQCRIRRYDMRTGRMTEYRYETPRELFPGRSAFPGEDCPKSIYRDRNGELWIATSFGILRLNEKTGVLRRYSHSGDDLLSFSNNIYCVFEDYVGRFWVGTDLGLDLFDRRTGIFRPIIHSSERLVGKAVFGIAEDGAGALWLQTDGMLLKYIHDTGEMKAYGPEAGFPITFLENSKQFGARACRSTSFGEIVIGIREGAVLFRPDELWENPERPRVAITYVNVFGKPLMPADLPVKRFALPVEPLRLDASHNSIEFEFAGLEYTRPEQIKYAVWLEPTDSRWSILGTRNSVRLIDLSPGDYRLRVKAANGDSAWSIAEASFRFEILPHWWQTRWAYFIYAVMVLGTICLTWKAQARKMRVRHEYQMSKFEAEKLQEIDEMKSRFFTNISHEFRTPLTLILGPVKQLAERIQDEKVKEELAMVHRNAGKLLRLVNELLDISKIESGNMKLQASMIDVVPLLKAVVLSFASHAERKRIQLKFHTSEEKIVACVDREKLERIITNIVSNAFKFTPEGGRIGVEVNRCDELLIISVSDTGIGIPREKIPKIFDRFYQVNGTHTKEQEGTGIGLALTKELVELHGGKIEVESEEGRGTVFNVSIPVGAGNCEREGLSEPTGTVSEAAKLELESAEEEVARSGNYDVDFAVDSKKPMLLIVEDNADVRYYLRENLKSRCRVVEAVNGEDGWNKSLEHLPDVIVSDVMMPKMDGFELCRKLKTDERTNHIPVILLTAKASSRDKIEGFDTGADEYIMKPFDSEELRARIGNLIAQRERLHEHFRSKGIFELEQANVRPADERFLRKVFGIIEENMSNSSFSVESLAEMVSVSRSVLGRKIVSLTGQAPVEIIRRIRLTRAAQLIENKTGNMSEIAFEVGFTNPAYFSECFKKQFGVSPSQYRRQKV